MISYIEEFAGNLTFSAPLRLRITVPPAPTICTSENGDAVYTEF
jgi:hypothetical protein